MRLAYGEKCLIVLTYNLCLVRLTVPVFTLCSKLDSTDPLLC